MAPIGFGFVGRAWVPRSSFVGTYDQHWLDHVCPFLPEDFDHRYHQGAPADQQFPHFRGGEIIRCFSMAERPVVQYTIPTLEMPVAFCFREGSVARAAVLDTIMLEPHLHRASLSWRTQVALGKNITDLKEIHLGVLPNDNADDGFLGYRRGKPVFRGIASTIRWLDRRRGRR